MIGQLNQILRLDVPANSIRCDLSRRDSASDSRSVYGMRAALLT